LPASSAAEHFTRWFSPVRGNVEPEAGLQIMSVFYADFDKNNRYNSILKPPQVGRDLLIKTLDEFLEFMNKLNNSILGSQLIIKGASVYSNCETLSKIIKHVINIKNSHRISNNINNDD
jgi:hypothetical protein